MDKLDNYYGRLFTQAQLSDALKKQAKQLPAMTKLNHHYVCNRCGSQVSLQNKLQTNVFYCRNCLVFGRNTSNGHLYYFPQKRFSKKDSLIWKGKLTPYQDDVSKGMLEGIDAKKDLLIHAVTGAGKTEMIYQSVSKIIDDGVLHGDSEPYKRAPLIIATTHQLLKFYQAFDLLIIDEVDAFPFVDNAVLYHAVDKAIKPNGTKIFLTATSTDELDKKVKTGTLTKLHLARRFHANPLVVPQKIWLSGVLSNMQKKKIPQKLINLLKKQRQTCYPLLIFFPNIEQGEAFTQILQTYFPEEQIAFVSSKTENRLEIVEKFRKQELSILVTTTILERGVTFPCVDVFVVLANHRLYTKSALVQISGRVGRAAERPTGELLFLHDGSTKEMRKAIAEIKAMNKKGGFA
ncbi:competence protein [Streptococcus gallolyticus subsp. gallolyticus]|uniref:Competence protein ComFA n=1 Tax=Streptococcus gallolyticus (strain UCN34) TaxID=637909 RepID=A0AA36NQ60_STRG3|nr:DEAD/DEAH box helicase [Streptococcus gallolyticus]KJF00305.1 competence protein [Streptococcus gallolyticus subsp. gallolyticus]CBI12994.1 putative competence protein ComFA [Streptococcus gallolyticus UCN34]